MSRGKFGRALVAKSAALSRAPRAAPRLYGHQMGSVISNARKAAAGARRMPTSTPRASIVENAVRNSARAKALAAEQRRLAAMRVPHGPGRAELSAIQSAQHARNGKRTARNIAIGVGVLGVGNAARNRHSSGVGPITGRPTGPYMF